MIQAVILDMDGLMFDTERITYEATADVARSMGLDYTVDIYKQTVGFNRGRTREFYQTYFGDDFDYERLRDGWRGVVEARIDREGLPVKPGLYELLDHVKQKGYSIGLATSTGEVKARDNLERAGVIDYFDALVCGDMVQSSKPAPDIYIEACRRVGVNANCALALEDSPNGIRSAHAAGLRVVMVPDMIEPSEEIEALLFARVARLDQVIDLLDS